MSWRAVMLLTLLAAASGSAPASSTEFDLHEVSSRSDAVSGGDALVGLRGPKGKQWTARLNGRDVTASFHPASRSPQQSLALLTSLKEGQNTLEIWTGGRSVAKLVLTNHPLSGPIFSGPHQVPFVCENEANGLGPPLDRNCSAPTLIQYYYKSADSPRPSEKIGEPESFKRWRQKMPPDLPSGFKPYPGDGLRPKDLVWTVTSAHHRVPYIVRREIGVINRAVYDIRFLHEPGSPLPTPWTGFGDGWNGRLVYVFYGGCGGGHHQGILSRMATDEVLLSRGYAVATSSLNIYENTCNDRISAETMSMVKEHFTKTLGTPVHTIGWGPSGGAMQLHLTAQNYPGLLDGIIPFESFPDAVTWTASTGTDCPLLVRAFGLLKGQLTDQQKSAVTGFANWHTCSRVAKPVSYVFVPRRCDSSIPPSEVYDATTNPVGVRCDIYDNEVNVLGLDQKTGFAQRPLDNVGVIYGLAAFNQGVIDAETLIELNEHIGGIDVDGNIVSHRTQSDIEAVRLAYQRGMTLSGGGGLASTPIIDWRWYTDDIAEGDVHVAVESFATRARLVASNGDAANQVILIDPKSPGVQEQDFDDPSPATSLIARKERDLVEYMDRWLDRITADGRPGSTPEKVARDKPRGLSDACWAVDGHKIAGEDVYDARGACSQLYPHFGNPRIAAGAPLTDNTLKCELTRLSSGAFARALNDEQLRRLAVVFPSGVCDYSRQGVAQAIASTTWQSF